MEYTGRMGVAGVGRVCSRGVEGVIGNAPSQLRSQLLLGRSMQISSSPRCPHGHNASFRAITKGLVIRSESVESRQGDEKLANRIASGEFTELKIGEGVSRKFRRGLANGGLVGRFLSMAAAMLERTRRLERVKKMPEAKGDVRTIVGQPFFLPLYTLFLTYGGVFRLNIGPKSFVIVSEPSFCRHILKENVKKYSKGILAEILNFIMGTGLIPADGEIWRTRRRTIVPALHQKFIAAMLDLFGESSQKVCNKLDQAAVQGAEVELESLFSQLTLDIIGKAVFNYNFDSLSKDTGIVEAVYVTLREAEARSIAIFPYWNIPPLAAISPRQQRVKAALQLINQTISKLIDRCKKILDEEGDFTFNEEYMNERDPSILRFLLASGDQVTSKQLRDDLMTLLIAGHETSSAVLTWTFYLLAKNPAISAKLRMEVDEILGDRWPSIQDMKKLKYATAVISESMRLYPQPPVLIRRALEDDMLGQYNIKKGDDIFISVWNLHRSPKIWDQPDEFRPERWIEAGSALEMSQNFSYLPFGGGPRKCVGDIFATYEVVTAMAMIVRRFNFEFAAGAPPVTMTTGATIHTENGLHMRVTSRINSSGSWDSEGIMKSPQILTRNQNLGKAALVDFTPVQL